MTGSFFNFSDLPNISDGMLVFISTLITGVLIYLTNSKSATSGAMNALGSAISTLRTELTSEQTARGAERKEYLKIIEELELNHKAQLEELEKKLEARFDEERVRYRRYINALIEQMRAKGITPIEWTPDE